MNRPVVSAILISPVVFAFLSTAAYHWLMFGPNVSWKSLIEASNCALQTITTVGYGNWVPASWDPVNDDELQTRILYVKAVSVLFMLVGGSLFAVVVGIIFNVLSRR
jgi:hypothetical protein